MGHATTNIRNALAHYRRAVLTNKLVEWVAWVGGGLCLAFLLALLMETVFFPSILWRRLIQLAICAAALLAVGWGMWQLLRPSSPSSWALEIERDAGVAFDNTLVSAVDFMGDDSVERFGFSRELVDACIDQAASRLGAVRVTTLVPWHRSKRALAVASILLVVAGVFFLRDRQASLHLVRLYLQWSPKPEATGAVRFQIDPGDIKVVEGSAVRIRVACHGRTGERPVLLKRVSRRVPEVVTLDDTGNGIFQVEFI